MEGAYWVYREHVLYHPKPTFDEVFFLLHFFFFNCPRLVATLLWTKILSWWPGALYISKIVWPVRVSRLEGTLVTQLMPLLPSNNRLGGLLLYIWTLRPGQRITLLGLETLMGSICQAICLEVVELFSSARVTIFSLVLPVWPFNVALLRSMEGASTWRMASSTSVQVGRNHPKMPGKMLPKHCAPLFWTYRYILWLGIHHT